MVAKIIERLKHSVQLWRWEQEKRKEGFPEEWFYDNPIDEDYLPTEEDVARVDEIQAELKEMRDGKL